MGLIYKNTHLEFAQGSIPPSPSEKKLMYCFRR